MLPIAVQHVSFCPHDSSANVPSRFQLAVAGHLWGGKRKPYLESCTVAL